MEKKILEVLINGDYQDCVIESYMTPVKDQSGKFIYTDEKNNIGKVKGAVHNITVYIKDDIDKKKVSSIYINAWTIKNLYDLITKIESEEREEYLDF